MKHTLTFVLTLLCIITLTACAHKSRGESLPPTQENLPNWGLTLTAEDITSKGLTLVVSQSGGDVHELTTGSPYYLQKQVGKKWEPVEEAPLPEGVDGRGWNTVAYIVPLNDSVEYEINWEWIYGEIPEGTYRLSKSFMNSQYGEYEEFSYWIEFVIE